MKKLVLLLPLILISCKDENWGGKVLDFAHNEAPTIVEDLSRKDLEEKWFQYFFMNSHFGLEETNKAHLMLASFKAPDFSNIQSDNLTLMKTAYLVDQQIEKTYEINKSLYNARTALQGMNEACNNSSLLDFYTGNRIYLYNSLQMAVPLLNVSYGATVNFSFGSDGAKKNKNEEDSIPLIGDVFSYFSQKAYKKNLDKFKEAQEYISNIKLDTVKLKTDSDSICSKNQAFFKETNDILNANISITQNELRSLYSALMKMRDILAPKVIQNIINNFSSEDQLVYSVEADTKFTQRVMQIYTYAQAIQPTEAKSPQELKRIEDQLDSLNNISLELSKMKENILGIKIKNQRVISTLSTLINNKKNLLSSFFTKGVQQ